MMSKKLVGAAARLRVELKGSWGRASGTAELTSAVKHAMAACYCSLLCCSCQGLFVSVVRHVVGIASECELQLFGDIARFPKADRAR